METPIYEIKSLTHFYADKPILDINQLEIAGSSIVGFVGPNGSGKSTLLRLLGLIERPTAGEIYFDGHSAEPFLNEARFQITLLPQEPVLMRRNVFSNVSYGLKLRGNRHKLDDRVNEALSMLGLRGEDFAHRPWYALSGGEMQRVALAARLALKPRVLLLDEPTASVDALSAQFIWDAALQARRDWGTTLIVASHDRQWLYEICDNILHLFKGKIFGSGYETIVFGPWEGLEKGVWRKKLSDHQELRVPAPPDKDAAAIIDTLSVGGDESKTDPGNVTLRGKVSILSLDKDTNRVFVTILAGSQPFTLALTYEQIQDLAICPGKSILIHYRIDHIKWI